MFKTYTAKVHISRPGFANYCNYFHSSTHDDQVYKKLSKTVADHKLLTGLDEIKAYVTKEGFYFKSDGVKIVDKNGRPTLFDSCLDRDVMMKMKISPYDFKTSSGERLVGVSISAKSIQVLSV